MDVRGKTAVVTGGASGIGLAIAKELGARGAKVVLGDVNQVSLDAAVQEIAALDGQASAVVCDVRREESVAALMAEAVARTGGLDIVIANAGILRDGLLVKVDRETGKPKGKMALKDWQDVIDVNLTGVFLTGREAAARMIEIGAKGVIIPMSSIARHGNAGQTNYAAAKAGVAAMTVTWAAELARFGIRVAGIAPGFIETPMVMKDMKPDALEKWKKMIPIGRLGKPEEIALTARFICENDLVTGTVYDVSGGIKM